MEMPVRVLAPHRERLAEVLGVLRAEPAISLNMATYWTEARSHGASPIGCPIGYYVYRRKPAHLTLVKLNFLGQLKAPIAAEAVWKAYPNREWRHHTLHYSGPEVEAWGLTAACLYFQLRPYDAQRLFWPNATNYQLTPDAKVMAERLERFLASEPSLPETVAQ